MNIIVSDILSSDKFTNYKVVPSLKDAKQIVDKKGCKVILHHTSESDATASLSIVALNRNLVAYISDKPSPALSMSVNGIGACVIEDEFYFDDESELDYCIQELDDGGDLVESPLSTLENNMSIIQNFVKAFKSGDSVIQTDFYMNSVEQAIEDVTRCIKETDVQVRSTNDSIISILREVRGIIDNINNSRLELESKLSELEQTLSTERVRQPVLPSAFQNAVSIFPPVKYLGTAKVLHVCEVSPCRFLTSFLLGYYYHLKLVKEKKVKLIVIHQKNKRSNLRYTSFTRVMPQTLHETDLVLSPMVVTDTPKLDVINKLTRLGDDVIIVLDRLYGDNILEGQIETLYAVSGLADIERFKLNVNRCIFTEVTPKESFLCIPRIKQYDRNPSTRQAQYHQHCADKYVKIDEMLGI